MKLCFSTLACPRWTLEQVFDAARQHDIGGIDFRGLGNEIDLTKVQAFSSHLGQTMAEMRRRNLVIPCLHTSVTLISPASDWWQMMLDECGRYARLAQHTGTQFLRIFGGAPPHELNAEQALAVARRHLKQIVKICQNHHCVPLVETHDAWATSAEMRELLSGFSTDEVGVLWDYEHSWRHGEPVHETAAELAKFIRHAHIKDSARVDNEYLPRLIGEGELPAGEFLAALDSIGYRDWICLETEKRWHPEAPEPEESIGQFAQWMARNRDSVS